jgi:hypothetical protein
MMRLLRGRQGELGVMTPVLRIVLIAGIALGFCQPALAYKSGYELLAQCSNKNNLFDLGQCYGFIIGTLEAGNDGRTFCIPSRGVANGQIYDIVTRYLSAHPEQLQTFAATLVMVAVGTSFPCRR